MAMGYLMRTWNQIDLSSDRKVIISSVVETRKPKRGGSTSVTVFPKYTSSGQSEFLVSTGYKNIPLLRNMGQVSYAWAASMKQQAMSTQKSPG